MADQFPIVIRGYDKEQVDRALPARNRRWPRCVRRSSRMGIVCCSCRRSCRRSATVSRPRTTRSPRWAPRPADACLRGADQHRAAGACQAGCRLDSRVRQGSGGDADQTTRSWMRSIFSMTLRPSRYDYRQRHQSGADHYDQRAAGRRPAARRNGEDRDRAASVRRSRTHQFARGA